MFAYINYDKRRSWQNKQSNKKQNKTKTKQNQKKNPTINTKQEW